MSLEAIRAIRGVVIKSDSLHRVSVDRQRAVLGELAIYAGKDCVAWPSTATMAWNLAIPRSAVRAALTALERQGLIVAASGRRGGHGSTRWQIDPAACDAKRAEPVTDAESAPGVACEGAEGRTSARQVPHVSALGAQLRSEEVNEVNELHEVGAAEPAPTVAGSPPTDTNWTTAPPQVRGEMQTYEHRNNRLTEHLQVEISRQPGETWNEASIRIDRAIRAAELELDASTQVITFASDEHQGES